MHCESKRQSTLVSIIGFIVGCILSFYGYSAREATAVNKQPDIQRFLPKDATLGEVLKIDLNNDGTDEIIFTYSRVVSSDPNISQAFGFTVLAYQAGKGWRAIHKEPAKWGSPEGISLGVIRKPIGSMAAFVVEEFAGAGVASAWRIITYIDGELKEIYGDPVTQQTLKAKGYTSLGYNNPQVVIGNIIEDTKLIATNDADQRRYLKIRYKFTGTSIEVVDTKVMEPDGGRYDSKKKTETELRVEAHEKSGANPELITDDEASDFILAWIDLSERHDKFDSVMGLYADEVDLYQFGKMQKSFAAEDKKNYFNKWPFRSYTLETVRLLPGVKSNEKRADVVFHYRLSNGKKVVHGDTTCILTIQKQKGKIQIVSEKSEK